MQAKIGKGHVDGFPPGPVGGFSLIEMPGLQAGDFAFSAISLRPGSGSSCSMKSSGGVVMALVSVKYTPLLIHRTMNSAAHLTADDQGILMTCPDCQSVNRRSDS